MTQTRMRTEYWCQPTCKATLRRLACSVALKYSIPVFCELRRDRVAFASVRATQPTYILNRPGKNLSADPVTLRFPSALVWVHP